MENIEDIEEYQLLQTLSPGTKKSVVKNKQKNKSIILKSTAKLRSSSNCSYQNCKNSFFSYDEVDIADGSVFSSCTHFICTVNPSTSLKDVKL